MLSSRLLAVLVVLGLVAASLGCCGENSVTKAKAYSDPDDTGDDDPNKADDVPDDEDADDADDADDNDDPDWEGCSSPCKPDAASRGRHDGLQLASGVDADDRVDCCNKCRDLGDECKFFNFYEKKSKCFIHGPRAKVRRGGTKVEGYFSGQCGGGSKSRSK